MKTTGTRVRLDTLLVEKQLVSGRDKAKSMIMAGLVYVDNQKADKPGMDVYSNCNVEVRGKTLKYVSRGGLKLEKAISEFSLVLKDKVCIDIGASTGGFTDCMLQNYACKVYAIDVGYGQLAWSLRVDPRVVVLERTNIRYVTAELVQEPADFVSIDVSFISLKLVLPVAYSLICDGASVVCLVKPQFEAGRDKIGKKGVVRELSTHTEVVQEIFDFAKSLGFSVKGITFSPITGPQGNIEYLLLLEKSSQPSMFDNEYITQLVIQSHKDLQEK